MKITGMMFVPVYANQGFKVSNKNGKTTRYAHLGFSEGRQQLVTVDGQPVMENGQPKRIWVNTHYSTSSFNGLADKLQELLEEAKAKGQKGIRLTLSGENTQEIVKNRAGENIIANNFRVISFQVEGEKLWYTTQNGQLVQRPMN